MRESLLYHKSYGTNSTDASIERDLDDTDKPALEELAEQFREATGDELKEFKDLVDGGDTTPPFSWLLNASSCSSCNRL